MSKHNPPHAPSAEPDPAAPAATSAPAPTARPRSHTVERRSRVIGTSRAFQAIKAEHAADYTSIERVANRLTEWAGSSAFLVLHAVWFLVWMTWNVKAVGQRLGLVPFDPFPFGLLTMVVSLEAIFLSIFVLMSQTRESSIAELREELNLQVNLRMEEEVTKTLQLVAGLYRRLGHELADDPDLREMLQPLDAKGIERQLIVQIKGTAAPDRAARAAAKRETKLEPMESAAAAAPPASAPSA